VSAIFLKTVLHQKMSSVIQPFILGERASLAASLDYALTKGPSWLVDMFGTTSQGALRAKRLFRVTNPNRKRPGPVVVSLNTSLLPPTNIGVTLDGSPVENEPLLLSMAESFLGKRLADEEAAIKLWTGISSQRALCPAA
jgi:hypothetical protein